MATEMKSASSLKLQFNKGLGTDGKEITGSKTFSNLKEDASPEDVLAVANAFGGLQKHDLYNIVKIDYTSISE
ncbi:MULTISPECIES: DUF1659 domain-containing protein [unclassified Romboutsia]|uniref:DUF1659 domain-containing protein n=1 Tax=unclassified Romboutsia TaxID=2626894 RepID=UPI000821A2E6|nr:MULTISPECIES: DUF1659 domain-containing protein [unclassified Romboutsia]SCI44397.1 Protein of uncharacterised function (DUF1659) [uncultured Clostridium sp.]